MNSQNKHHKEHHHNHSEMDGKKERHDSHHHENHGHSHHEKHENQHHGNHHDEHDHSSHDHSEHHAMMIKDFRKRFWISLVLTLPVLVLSPMIQQLLGFEFALFPKFDPYILFGLSTV